MRVLVIGVGNRLRGDDGFGSCLAEALAEVSGLNVVDGDVRGIGLVDELEGFDYVIFLDVMEGLRSGEVALFRISHERPNADIPPTSHRLSPRTITSLARGAGVFDGEAYLIAVGPYNMEFAEMPSEYVTRSLPKVLETLRRILEELGVEAHFDEGHIVGRFLRCYEEALMVER